MPGSDKSETEWDVIIIGGGPAGSTAATTLAQAGRRVLVLEKSKFPRFHIGESLLPANVPLFEKLAWTGLADEVLHGRLHRLMRADLSAYPPCHTPYAGHVAASRPRA